MIKIIAFVLFVATPYILCNEYIQGLENLDQKLQGYDKRIRPGIGEKPVNVTVSLHVIRAWDYNKKISSLKLEFYFRQEWFDERLASEKRPPIYAQELENVIWKPDTYFSTATDEKRHEVPSKNFFVKIGEDGKVCLSQRITCEVFCEAKTDFPKNCTLDIESYGFGTEDIVYSWRQDNASKVNAVSLSPEIPGILGHRLISKIVQLSTGNYSVLSFKIVIVTPDL